MPDCSYCDAEFADESAYHEHLRDVHADELDRIDRRRVGLVDGGDEDGAPIAMYAVLVGGVALALVGVYLVAGGSSPASNPGTAAASPHDYGAVHYHGTIQVTVDGQQLDFGRDRYQLQDRYFHFERGNGDRWHVHGRGVTLAYAMGTLGVDLRDGGDTLAFDGTTYRDAASGTSVSVTVDGEPVAPGEYVLQRGDTVRIVVRSN